VSAHAWGYSLSDEWDCFRTGGCRKIDLIINQTEHNYENHYNAES